MGRDDVRDALGALLIDEPAFELRAGDLVGAASRHRRHRSGWLVTIAATAAAVVAVVAVGPVHRAVPTGPLSACQPTWIAAGDGPTPAELYRLRGLRMAQALCRLLGPGARALAGPVTSPFPAPADVPGAVASYEGGYQVDLTYDRDGHRDGVYLTVRFGLRTPSDTCASGAACIAGADGSYASVVRSDGGVVYLRAFQPDGTSITGKVTPQSSGSALASDSDLYALLADPQLSARSPLRGAMSEETWCGQAASPTAAAICGALPSNWRDAVITERSPTTWRLTYLDGALVGEVAFEIGSPFAQAAFSGSCGGPCRTLQTRVDGVTVTRVEDAHGGIVLDEQAAVGSVWGRLFPLSEGFAANNDEAAIGHLLVAGIRAYVASAG
ncbi:MAG: hypothetical protein QOH13_2389 [Thermoleophilaceae bacterium]|nr:hypothetical protein [Thermoleophilaceae bacterium]